MFARDDHNAPRLLPGREHGDKPLRQLAQLLFHVIRTVKLAGTATKPEIALHTGLTTASIHSFKDAATLEYEKIFGSADTCPLV